MRAKDSNLKFRVLRLNSDLTMNTKDFFKGILGFNPLDDLYYLVDDEDLRERAIEDWCLKNNCVTDEDYYEAELYAEEILEKERDIIHTTYQRVVQNYIADLLTSVGVFVTYSRDVAHVHSDDWSLTAVMIADLYESIPGGAKEYLGIKSDDSLSVARHLPVVSFVPELTRGVNFKVELSNLLHEEVEKAEPSL